MCVCVNEKVMDESVTDKPVNDDKNDHVNDEVAMGSEHVNDSVEASDVAAIERDPAATSVTEQVNDPATAKKDRRGKWQIRRIVIKEMMNRIL
jgi:hypothetical protein